MEESHRTVDLPGKVDSLVITYESTQSVAGAQDRRVQQWFLTIETVDEHGDAVDTVGNVLAHVVDHYDEPDLSADLVGTPPDLDPLARSAFDAAGESLDAGLLIIHSVRLKPGWQGRGLEALVVGMAIEHLAANRRLVVLRAEPATPDLGAQLGFRPLKDGIWTLHPERTRLAGTMRSLRTALGVS